MGSLPDAGIPGEAGKKGGAHGDSWFGAGGVRSVQAYYAFVLVSTVFRSYESGIVSSSMPSIKHDLQLSYTHQGFVASASDYGLLPSGLLAMLILTRLPAYSVLSAAYFAVAVLSLLCALFPSFTLLVLTRGVTSFFWGMAAVYYPAWVNGHGAKEGKTMRLAVLNAVMLAGILLGYLVGGISRSMGGISWTYLYGVEAVLMFACGVCGSCFDRAVVQTEESSPEPSAHKSVQDAFDDADESTPLQPTAGRTSAVGGLLPADLVSVCTCPLYIFSVAISSAISGVVGFILYFSTQVGEEVLAYDTKVLNIVVAVVFVFGPVGGNLGGGLWLSRCGGYQNYEHAFRLVALWMLCAWVCSALLPVAFALHSQALFAFALFGLLLSGAAAVPAINGAAVNAVPGPAAATYGSGIQFFGQHLVKMLAPMIGGRVIDCVGLGAGFGTMVIALGGLCNVSAWLAYWAARNHR